MPRASAPDDELITGVNVTPLVDIVLVLLVVMMVAAAYVTARAIPVELPSEARADTDSSPAVVITVAADGALTVDGLAVDRETLKHRLRAFAGGSSEPRAVIQGEALASHGAVVSVLDVLRHEHITRVAFQPPAP